jgi:RNA polymerase sigma factor (sigma-70 family)
MRRAARANMTDHGRNSRLETVVLPHLNAAYNLACWLVRDRTEAQDVVQDALLRAVRYFPSFRGDNPRAWLLQIVRNVAHGRLAKRGSAPSDFGFGRDEDPGDQAMEVRDPADDPEAALSRRQDWQRLQSVLAALPAELVECLVLKELEDMSYKEIAVVTGVPIGTVMSRLWRARQALVAVARSGVGS